MLLVDFIEFSSVRVIKVYVIFPILVAILLTLGFKIKKRGQTTRQTKIITKFFFYTGFGILINLFYAPFADETIQRIGNNSILLIVTVGYANLLNFTLSLKHSERTFTNKKAWMVEIVVALLMFALFFFPEGTTFPEDDYLPKWSLAFVIYGIILTSIIVIYSFIVGFQVAAKIDNQEVKKKIIMFLLGLICMMILYMSNFLGNGRLVSGDLFTFLSIFILPGGILIYLGVGRPLEPNKSTNKSAKSEE
jgi:hypothetical protein